MPTDDEFDRAERKYLKWLQAHLAEHPGDMSDFTMGNFSFCMGTYAAFTWARFFGVDVKPPDFSFAFRPTDAATVTISDMLTRFV